MPKSLTSDDIVEKMAFSVPRKIQEDVRENEDLYPRMNTYKTLDKVQERMQRVRTLKQITKDPSMKKRYNNEILSLLGKSVFLSSKDWGPMANLKNLKARVCETEIPGEDEERAEKSYALATAMYYYTGLKLTE